MNEKLIDEYVEHAMKDVPPERREDVKKDMKIRIMEKVIATASAKKSPVNDEVVAEVLRQWPPYRPLKGIMAPAPAKISVTNDLRKALLPLAGLVLAFVVLDAAFLLLVPDAAGMPKADLAAILLAVVFALVTAILVIGAIFASMYIYHNRIKKSQGDRIERVEKVMKDAASPVRVGVLTVAMLAWMAVLYLWWKEVILPSFDTSGTMLRFFSDGFSSFVPLILLLGVAMIVVNVLYLIVTAKWLVSMAETLVNAGVMLVFYMMIQSFPFNAAFPPAVKTGIYLMLCLVFLGLAVGVAKNILQTLRFMNYGSGRLTHHKRSHL